MKKLNSVCAGLLLLLISCSPVSPGSTRPQSENAEELNSTHGKAAAPDADTEADTGIEAKLSPESSFQETRNLLFATGVQPKQVLFTPDGKSLIVPLLKGPGFSFVDRIDGTVRTVNVPGYDDQEGFVEAVFNPGGSLFYISQMTTGMVHVFTPEAEYLHSFSSGGKWSKVLAFSPDGTLLAVSNWLSHSVTILNAGDESVITRLTAEGAEVPRGTVFSRDGTSLLVAFFGSGDIVRFSVKDWTIVSRIHTGGAPRHIVLHPQKPLAYISNMASRKVHVLNLETGKITADIQVGPNPNTIDLSPDGSRLYVSCRGLNNPENYTLRSPENGEVHVIDTGSLARVKIIPGGNQPTGLDVSGDGKFLAFTNFQDNTVEVYPLF